MTVTLRYAPVTTARSADGKPERFPQGRCAAHADLDSARAQAEADLHEADGKRNTSDLVPVDIVDGPPGDDPFSEDRDVLWRADE